MAYRVRLTDTSVAVVRFVRDGNGWDASWATRHASEAKTWKTRRGAQRWIDGRSGVEAVVEEASAQ